MLRPVDADAYLYLSNKLRAYIGSSVSRRPSGGEF